MTNMSEFAIYFTGNNNNDVVNELIMVFDFLSISCSP